MFNRIERKCRWIAVIMLVCLSVSSCMKHNNDKDISSERIEKSEIVDKNLKLEEPYLFVVDSEDMDDFWKGYLSDIDIKNEWFHAADTGYCVAIFGALKDNPEQGIADVLSLTPDCTIISAERILAPIKGGSLSVMEGTSTAKEFNMEVQEESGKEYLFNFFNGFTAYKEERDGDWQLLTCGY